MGNSVLVLGGTRYFGRHLCERLLERGHEVTVLTRTPKGGLSDARVRRIFADRSQADSLARALGERSFDLIYDQICYTAPEARLACELLKDRAPTYVFTSSMSVYRPGQMIREEAFDAREHLFSKLETKDSDYAEAKRQAEAVFARQWKGWLACARFPFVLGADDYTERLDFHVRHVLRGTPYFVPNLDARLSFINARDAGRFLSEIPRLELEGALNCASPEPIRLSFLITLIEKAVGKRSLHSCEEGSGPQSPYGATADWYMDTTRVRQGGYEPEPLLSWLPELIEKVVARERIKG